MVAGCNYKPVSLQGEREREREREREEERNLNWPVTEPELAAREKRRCSNLLRNIRISLGELI